MDDDYAMINCNIVDIANGCVNSDMVILISKKGTRGVAEGTLTNIGKMGDIVIPNGCRQVDAGGRYVMPGLINAHVHLFSSGKPTKEMPSIRQQRRIFGFAGTAVGGKILKNSMKKRAQTMLQSGVTTIRCVGDPFYKDIEIRDEIESGRYLGPRMKVSGYMIGITGGHGAPFITMESDSPWEDRKRARQNIRAGADFIKMCVTGGVVDARAVGEAGRLQMTEEEVAAVCDEAHKIGLLVAAHVQSTEGVRLALKGGVDTIEHGSTMDEEIVSLYKNNPRSLRGYSAVVPTLYAAIPGFIDKKITGFRDVVMENSTAVFNGMVTGLKQALEAGVKVGLGTDAAMPYVTHYNTWRELEYLVGYAGLTPGQALYHATKANAEIMGIDGLTGTLETGKAADFIVVEENPLQNLKTLSHPVMIAARGNLIEKPRVKILGGIDEALETVQPKIR